jgi:hypothetical protein
MDLSAGAVFAQHVSGAVQLLLLDGGKERCAQGETQACLKEGASFHGVYHGK